MIISKRQLVFIATVSLLLTTGCSLVGIGNKTEKIEEMGIKLERPASWPKSNVQNDEKYIDYTIALPQKSTEKTNIEGHIAISVAKPVGNQKVVLDDEIKGFIAYLGNTVSGLKEVSRKETEFLGEKATQVILQFRNNEDKSISEKVIVTIAVKDNKAYSIFLDEDTADFDAFLPDYDKILSSITAL